MAASGGEGYGFGGAGNVGGSFMADFATMPFILGNVNEGNVFITLNLFAAAPTTNDVPEPSTLILFALALLGLGVAVRRRTTP